MAARTPVLLVALALVAGCARYGVVDDGTSVSYGPSNAGILLKPSRLPVTGQGYVMPERWARRGLRYGTDEAVSLVVYAAREVQEQRPGATLGVGDLSPKRGGPSAWHRSHQTGRDVDLIYFAVDDDGQPVEPQYMHRFDSEGNVVRNSEDEDAPVLRFDVERNWLLVKALIDNPIADVQWIFVADWLKQLMLDHAKARGEPTHVILAASYLLWQPGDSLPHDDHMHLRVYCAPTDRIIGCEDRGSYRWLKRDRKYRYRHSARAYVEPLVRLVARQRITALALSALPFPGFVAR